MIKKMINRINTNPIVEKVLKNTSWILVENLINLCLAFVINVLIARYFGAEKYGTFRYVLSIITLFSGIASFGIQHIAIKDLKYKSEKENIILGTSFTIRVILSLILMGLANILVGLINGQDKDIRIMASILSSMMLFNSFEVIDYYNNANMKVKYTVIPRIVAIVFVSMLKILIIILDLDLIYYAIMYLIETIIYALGLSVAYRIIKKQKSEKIKWKFNKRYAKELLGKSWYFALSALMITIYMKIDQTMLGIIIEDKSEVGVYSVAAQIAEMWSVVPVAIITAIRPVIMENKKENEDKYRESLKRLYYIISGIGLCFALGITIFSKLIIGILYGNEYMAAAPLLSIIVFGTWIACLGNVHYLWFVCEDKYKYSVYYSIVGSVSNIVLNLILMPKYKALGAAIATVGSQTMANVFSFAVFKETRELTYYSIKAIFMVDFFKDIKQKIKGGYNK